MKFFFVYVLCAMSSVFSAQDAVFTSERKIYMPFRERALMTPAWLKIKAIASQEKLDNLLYEFARIPCPDQDYYSRRKEIAAAIFAGATVPQVQTQLQTLSCQSLLPSVVLKDDIPLVHLLLVRGADVHELDLKGERAIYHAKTVNMALLLIKHKALDDLPEVEKFRIFQRIMLHDYDSSLIKLYKLHGFDPALWPNNGMLLRSLVHHPHQDITKKAELIFEKMCPKQILTMINGARAGFSKTIFDEIEARQQRASSQGSAQLAKLYDFLTIYVNECPICLEHMNIASYAKTSCGHLFHAKCLQVWQGQCVMEQKDRKVSCPICRKVM